MQPPAVAYIPGMSDMNDHIRYQEFLRSQENPNLFLQPVQHALEGFNHGLAVALNSFGLNITQRAPQQDLKQYCNICGKFASLDEFFKKNNIHKKMYCQIQ